jgi:dTDP-4-amino-4,6-dideoxygalactose transaminase
VARVGGGVRRQMKVPLVDLGPQHAETASDALRAIGEVVSSGRFILGEAVAQFERTMAGLAGTADAVAVASGTDALVLALRALGVGADGGGGARDLVITTPLTFAATAEAIVRAGAHPVFCDVDPDSLCLSPGAVRARIEAMRAGERARLRAIVPVHLFGRACEMRALAEIARAHGLRIVEDAAQAIGARAGDARVGGTGNAGCFSFFPSKNLGGWGDGGAVTTADPAIAARVRRLRVHGAEAGRFVELGMNSRLDALQAAVLGVKAPHLARWTAERVRVAERYRALLAPLSERVVLPVHGPAGEHVFHMYVVRVPRGRDAMSALLARAGVETRAYYATPLHREPCFAPFDSPRLPSAERAAGELLALPLFYGITAEQQDYVARSLGRALDELA